SATDPDQGTLADPALTWTMIMHHCQGTCHEHTIETRVGSTGSFTAPQHEYPCYLELRLTATDAGGLTDTKNVIRLPETVEITLASDPPGLVLGENLQVDVAPFTHRHVVGSRVDLLAPWPQTINGQGYGFVSWSDQGAQLHEIIAPAQDTATYT